MGTQAKALRAPEKMIAAAIDSEMIKAPARSRSQVSGFVELTKPRITVLIVLTAAAGYCMGTKGSMNYLGLLNTSLGITILSSGIAALNQYLERRTDGLMRRTERRPLPSKLLKPSQALVFGILLSVIAEAYLAVLVNPLTAFLGLIGFASYLFVYTPLKTRTTLCTAIGAIPGAVPALMGWTAAQGHITIGGWVLFAILFLWQFPHFFAIAWMYREDYARAGIKMLPVIDPDGRITGRQILIYTVMLLPVSLLPTILGLAGNVYLYGAMILGLAFLFFGIRTAMVRSSIEARRLLQASVLYLPLLWILMVLNQRS